MNVGMMAYPRVQRNFTTARQKSRPACWVRPFCRVIGKSQAMIRRTHQRPWAATTIEDRWPARPPSLGAFDAALQVGEQPRRRRSDGPPTQTWPGGRSLLRRREPPTSASFPHENRRATGRAWQKAEHQTPRVRLIAPSPAPRSWAVPGVGCAQKSGQQYERQEFAPSPFQGEGWGEGPGACEAQEPLGISARAGPSPQPSPCEGEGRRRAGFGTAPDGHLRAPGFLGHPPACFPPANLVRCGSETLWIDRGTQTMKLLVTLARDESGKIVAECPALPGCVSQGRTEDEATANTRKAIAACLEARAQAGMPLTVAIFGRSSRSE